MTGKTKILISQPELELVMNQEWILTKARIISKVYDLFAGHANLIKNIIDEPGNLIPREVKLREPRIFKGENYKGLPYVILDCPAIFGKQDVFAMRTLFWWGNFFSIQLQLSGRYKTIFENNIFKNLQASPGKFYLSISDDQWDHDLNSGGYISPSSKDEMPWPPQNGFLKLAVKFDLMQWNEITGLMGPAYSDILDLLKD